MNAEQAIKVLSTCRGCKYITASHECLDSGECFEAKQMAIMALYEFTGEIDGRSNNQTYIR